MATTYENTRTENISLTRLHAGGGKVGLQITGTYLGYGVDNWIKFSYSEVKSLQGKMSKFLLANKTIEEALYSLSSTLILTKTQVYSLIEDLDLYLNDEIHGETK